MEKYKLILAIIITLAACRCVQDDNSYSFFVVGHAYGHPLGLNKGLQPSFVNHIKSINQDSTIDLGIFTGDILRCRRAICIDSVKNQLARIKVPVHIAPGNHDFYPTFESDFNQYFYIFLNKSDLFIILSPGLDNWNITGAQLTFLKDILTKNIHSSKRIFLFMHELIWWSPQKYPDIKINFKDNYPGQTNFDKEILPLLYSLQKEIFVFAGDLGCTHQVTQYLKEKSANVTFIASGIGSSKNEYYLKVEVSKDDVNTILVPIRDKSKSPDIKLTTLEDRTYYYF